MKNFKLFFEARKKAIELPDSPGSITLHGTAKHLAETGEAVDDYEWYSFHVQSVRGYIDKFIQQLGEVLGVTITYNIRKSFDRISNTRYILNLDDTYNPYFNIHNTVFIDVNKSVKMERKTLKLGKYTFFENEEAVHGNFYDRNIQEYLLPGVKFHLRFLIKNGYKPLECYILRGKKDRKKFMYVKPDTVYVTFKKDNEPYVYMRKYTPHGDMSQAMLYSRDRRQKVHHLTFVKPYTDSIEIIQTIKSETYVRKADQKRHRLDGPAVIIWNQSGDEIAAEYYINGVQYTEEEFDNYVRGLNKDEVDMLSDLGQTFE